MEHIIQFGVNIDDNSIRKAVENEAKKQIIGDLKKSLSKSFFAQRYFNGEPDPSYGFTDYSKDLIMDFLNENKQDIIELAAKLFAEKMVRTKAGKEVIEQVKKNHS
jgi:hypothetical protein